MKDKQIKVGAVLSYVLIVLNTVIGLFITPFIIRSIGDSEYGVYSIMNSLATSLLVIDLGVGTTTTRFIAVMNGKNEQKKIDNYIAMNVIIAAAISFVIMIAGVVCFFNIDNLYRSTLSTAQLGEAKQLFVVIMITVLSQIFENVINGAIRGYGKYVFSNSLKVIRIVMRVVLIVALMQVWSNAMMIAIVDLVGGFAIIFAELIYLRHMNVRIRLYQFEWSIFKTSAVYTGLILVQSIANQFSGNLDKLVIGAVVSAEAVTVYTIGLTIYSMFANLGLSIPDLMLPKMAQMIGNGADNKELEDISVRVGRVQFIILGAAFAGFAVLGQLFIKLWMGEGYGDAYIITMILISPTVVTLTQKIGLVILKVRNKLLFRTIAVGVMAIVNLAVTVIGVKLFGYFAAAVGTSLTFLFCDFVAMNIYYKKVLGLDYFRVFLRTIKRILPCLLVSTVALLAYRYFTGDTLLAFIGGVAVFCVVYAVALILYGFNSEEKEMFLGVLKKLHIIKERRK